MNRRSVIKTVAFGAFSTLSNAIPPIAKNNKSPFREQLFKWLDCGHRRLHFGLPVSFVHRERTSGESESDWIDYVNNRKNVVLVMSNAEKKETMIKFGCDPSKIISQVEMNESKFKRLIIFDFYLVDSDWRDFKCDIVTTQHFNGLKEKEGERFEKIVDFEIEPSIEFDQVLVCGDCPLLSKKDVDINLEYHKKIRMSA